MWKNALQAVAALRKLDGHNSMPVFANIQIEVVLA